MGKDKLPQRVIHRKPIHAPALHRNHQLCRRPVHREARRHEFGARQQEFRRLALGSLLQLEDAKDGPDANARVEVAATVDGVADDGVTGGRVFGEDEAVLFFFRDEEPAFAGRAHGGDEEVVADYVELFLIVAGCVGGSSEAGEVDEGGAADVVGYGFEGELEGVAEEAGEWTLVESLERGMLRGRYGKVWINEMTRT